MCERDNRPFDLDIIVPHPFALVNELWVDFVSRWCWCGFHYMESTKSTKLSQMLV